MTLETTPSTRQACCRGLRVFLGLALLALLGVGGYFAVTQFLLAPKAKAEAIAPEKEERAVPAPELEGGVEWLNTAAPLTLKDLRGKVVLLDFWTYCCINCIHMLPDLAKLEKKYEDQLVVIGVHSAKFEGEKVSENIREAILRYEISHPVVNDAEMKIWRAYNARSWPTLWLIDPEGNLVGYTSGEGRYDILDREIGKLVEEHRKKKTLNEKPMKFRLDRDSLDGKSPLFFPGKVLADEKSERLFIADSTHHRIVVTDLDGKKIAVIGQGQAGNKDGSYETARLNDPQGMELIGETLYVADRKNHTIRAIDLKYKKVTTVAGTGEQGYNRLRGGPGLKTGLNSPWALLHHEGTMYIAMAGYHQIWAMDMKSKAVRPFHGNGREDLYDGNPDESNFAQPSGLATDGKWLYIADSEVSAIRAVPLDGKGESKTLVGKGLFEFGDKDGVGDDVRLQHALGVVHVDGKLYVADTYNSKIKTLDPETRRCTTLVGGEQAGWLAGATFNEPGGLSHAKGKLYVADTNAHRIRVVDPASKSVTTLKLQGVEPPKAK